jgi:N-acetylmuramic acid 6-phosphate etherase
MNLLGIEGGGTRTSVLLVRHAEGSGPGGEATLAAFSLGPGNLQLLPGEALDRHLAEIRDRLPEPPARIGAGLAGMRSAGDRDRLAAALARVWPGVPAAVADDLAIALEASQWRPDCEAQVLVVSGTGSCCLGRNRAGERVKVGGRGHVIGDRGSACDIALHALRSVVTLSDIHADWPALGGDLLGHLQMNEPEALIEWSMGASKAELGGLARVVFEAAATRGDENALAILKRAAERLAKDSVHCAARLARRGDKVQFVLNGSVLLKNPVFAEGVAARIREARPRSEVVPLARPGVWGAVALARGIAVGGEASAARASEPAMPSAATPPPGTERDLPQWKPVAASPTEGRNPRSEHLSEMPLAEAIRLMLEEDATLPTAILAESERIEWTVERVARAFAEGGRLLYCGAGTSGRLGVLDASECPPTFRSPAQQVQGIIAGGRTALWSAVEGAEDDDASGRSAIAHRGVGPADVVVGISASGHAPFVWGCLDEAKRRGAATVLVCCNPGYRGHPLADQTILPDTGPEVLTGSTRLKAGTATKLVLNLVSTLAMVRSGKVLGNLMVDLNPSNTKLRGRAVRIVSELTGAAEEEARAALERCGWVVREACAALGRQA